MLSSALKNHSKQSVSTENSASPTHTDLAELATILFEQPHDRPAWFQDAKRMTSYAVGSRYPGFDDPVTETEWREAVRIAKTVLDWATSIIANG